MKQWARKKLEESPEKFIESQKEYNDGDILKVGNEEYLLRIILGEKQGGSARLDGSTIYLWISSNLPKDVRNKYVSTLLSRCIARKRLTFLQEKIHELNAKHFNQEINRIFFKHNKSNWGSCSSKGNINISTRLLFAPDDVLEYVCIHELAHLIERNHSKNF
ncbi:MAG: YgjP-like metallopeptidase domain-containing protein [Nanoarchaeota archaeon]|nr:YgjP-like metallopeptidase domain-containing protein [Nanoarchaeota archaeon]